MQTTNLSYLTRPLALAHLDLSVASRLLAAHCKVLQSVVAAWLDEHPDEQRANLLAVYCEGLCRGSHACSNRPCMGPCTIWPPEYGIPLSWWWPPAEANGWRGSTGKGRWATRPIRTWAKWAPGSRRRAPPVLIPLPVTIPEVTITLSVSVSVPVAKVALPLSFPLAARVGR